MPTYGSTSGAGALVPSWNGSTNPTLAQVTVWLGDAYAIINRAIGNSGYSAPVASTATVYDELAALNNLYAAAYILRSLSIDTASGETEDRSEVWLKDFWTRLKDMVNSNLSLIGVVVLPAATTSRRRRIRTLQMRKVDGYSRGSTDENTGASAPSE